MLSREQSTLKNTNTALRFLCIPETGSGSAFAAGSTGGRPFGIFGQTFTSGGGSGVQQSSSSTSTGTQQDLCSGSVSQQDRTMVPTF